MSAENTARKIPAGACIFREGEDGDCAYLIEAGQVRICTGTTQVVAILNPGEVFGEMALIDGRSRSTSAHAVEPCTLLPIPRELMERKLRQGDPLTRLLLKMALKRYHDQQGVAGSNTKQTNHGRTLQLVTTELSLTNDLRIALEAEHLKVFYQPILRLADGGIAGFEALVRWNRADVGMVPPIEFIGVAETTGLIIPLGRQVLARACRDLNVLQEACGISFVPPFMSVNLSAHQLYQDGEVEKLLATALETGIDLAHLKLEITESALLDDPEVAASAMRRLREAGVRLAIDDFGTGYSSLSYLQSFPLHTLKIDKSFVDPLQQSGTGGRLVRAIISMARELELAVIAEGIETSPQHEQLRDFGCELGQGYLFSKPVDVDTALGWIRERQ